MMARRCRRAVHPKVLQEMQPQHAVQPNRRAAVASFGYNGSITAHSSRLIAQQPIKITLRSPPSPMLSEFRGTAYRAKLAHSRLLALA
jgi:hypothetical protein